MGMLFGVIATRHGNSVQGVSVQEDFVRRYLLQRDFVQGVSG